jgi:hypothetical protein
MAYAVFTEDKMAAARDADVAHVYANGTYFLSHDYLVISHDAMALDVFPDVYVDGTLVTLGAVGSGADYEASRTSATQTVIYKKSSGAVNITIGGSLTYATIPSNLEGGLPIGQAAIGSSFMIG